MCKLIQMLCYHPTVHDNAEVQRLKNLSLRMCYNISYRYKVQQYPLDLTFVYCIMLRQSSLAGRYHIFLSLSVNIP